MSDRETIVRILKTAQSRIRRNRIFDRIASGFCIFVLAGIVVKAVGLVILLNPGFLRAFWIVWLAALIVFLIRAMRSEDDLGTTAGNLDSRARLNDEVLSAYWFLNQRSTTPWVELLIQRAARSVGRLNVRNLYPHVLPKTSYLAGGGLILLMVLNFAPLPFTPGLLFSTPMPDLEELDRQTRLNEIDTLLAEAEALNANLALAEFQQLVEEMRNADLALEQTDDQSSRVESLLDEGNLNINNLLEGLEQMGEDLQRSEETAPTGEALSEGDLQAAAEELERLAEQLANGSPASNELQEALEEASENSRAGLEELAAALEAASEALGEENSESAQESLMEAAETLGELSDIVQSQQLQNQAAREMEALREALRQLENRESQQGEPGENGESSESDGGQGEQQDPSSEAGDAAASTPQEGEGRTPQEGSQSGSAEGASEFTAGEAQEGAPSDQSMPPIAGDLQNLEPTGTGDTPTGIGFSPAQKTGEPTSLEVQLLLQTTLALSNEDLPRPDPERREEATRQERSSLDYRSVPSELTPAQQELLNQERIPREYQNVIKEYFQAIRPRPETQD